jgi:hypothetical protein
MSYYAEELTKWMNMIIQVINYNNKTILFFHVLHTDCFYFY